MSAIAETYAEASDQEAPPFPQDYRTEFVVWADIDTFGMPRDAFVHEQRYLKTKSTGTLHAVDGYGSCIKPGRMVEVAVPLVADSPDTASRCSRCIGYRRGDDAPPRAMTNAVALVGRLKWLGDFVTALEARVDTLDRASTLAFRRRGPSSARTDDDIELDPRVRKAALGVVATLEARRRAALERIERRLDDDRSDIAEFLDGLVVDLATREAWTILEEETRTGLWPLLNCVEGRHHAPTTLWDAAKRAWADSLARDFAARAAAVDEAVTPYLDAPVLHVGPLRSEGEWLVRDGSAYASPTDWLDEELRRRRTRLAEHWARTLDRQHAEARRLREDEPDHYLLTTDWDDQGPLRCDELHAVLAAFPHTTADIERVSRWSAKPGTAALLRVPAVLAHWLAGNEWTAFDMGATAGRSLDGATLHTLMDETLGRADG